MIGIIVQWETRVVVAIAKTQPEAELIAMQLFTQEGINVTGLTMAISVFEPKDPGGLLIDTAGSEDLTDVSGWSLEGYDGE